MRKIEFRKISSFLLAIMLLLAVVPLQTFAAEDTRYGLGVESLINAGKDTGYAEANALDKDDPHWGWQLGKFYVSDFTRVSKAEDGTPTFLKNVGDKVTLWFSLEQDINCLNGNDKLSISEDKNGWDQRLGVEQQNFGRGMLIVKHTDYQNNATVTVYENFLEANATTTADTKVSLCEEGDYEIALDYEIDKASVNILGWEPVHSYTNYRITFKFSVRNGNCMVFPFDVTTGEELTNTDITENGFYLDLANSRYLDIDIKKEVLKDGADGVTEDIRFNRPAKDGNEYTDEGIYTITVSNRYTDTETTKVIYVGANDILKAYVVTGLSIAEIEGQLAAGATIADDGTIIPPETQATVPQTIVEETLAETSPEASSQAETTSFTEEAKGVLNDNSKHSDNTLVVPIVAVSVVVVVLIASVLTLRKRKKGKNEYTTREGDEEE